jgi:hypothetical protein
MNLFCRVNTVKTWHADIDNNGIGLQCFCEFHGGSTVRSFTCYPETLALKQRPESFSHQSVIVRDQDLKRH